MITSKQNPKFKYWLKLKMKKYRDEYERFLVYGDHQIEKARETNKIEEIITSNALIEGTLIDVKLMNELQQAETFFETLAVCKIENKSIDSNKVLLLDDIQDPDNLGALIRSAAAFGFIKIIASHKSADFYNEKTIRASKGSLFDVELIRGPLIPKINDLKSLGYKVIGANAHGKTSFDQGKKIALVLGNEGHGISQDVQDLCDGFVTIKTNRVESLNVSVAGGILMHAWREL